MEYYAINIDLSHSLAPFPRQQRSQPNLASSFSALRTPPKKISEKHPRPRFFVHAREEEDGAVHGGGGGRNSLGQRDSKLISLAVASGSRESGNLENWRR